jgi:penicillin amidase
VIHVKGQEDTILRVKESVFGPVISNLDMKVFSSKWLSTSAHRRLWLFAVQHGNISDTPLSFKWTSLEQDDDTLEVGSALLRCCAGSLAFSQAFLGVNRAQNWTDFRAALRLFKAPSQNFSASCLHDVRVHLLIRAVFADTASNIGWQVPGKIPIRKPGHSGLYPVLPRMR